MPGPVSDSYDPEWGISDTAERIRNALNGVYCRVSDIIGEVPMDIRELVRADLPTGIPATLTEREWRLLRFAVHRALESI